MAEWLRTDEIGELTDAIEHSVELARGVRAKRSNWKWLILALHNATQGALVCALRGHDTSGTTVLANSAEVLAWLNSGRAQPAPTERLATLIDLYKRAKRSSYLPAPHTLPATPTMTKDLKILSHLRNTYSHFVPMGLSIELDGLPRVASSCCSAIEYLAVEKPTFWHHLSDSSRPRLRTAVEALREATERLRGAAT